MQGLAIGACVSPTCIIAAVRASDDFYPIA
jgi:hypothetical protein